MYHAIMPITEKPPIIIAIVIPVIAEELSPDELGALADGLAEVEEDGGATTGETVGASDERVVMIIFGREVSQNIASYEV